MLNQSKSIIAHTLFKSISAVKLLSSVNSYSNRILMKMGYLKINRPVGRVLKDLAVGAGGLGLDFLAGQTGHSVANASPPLSRFSELSCLGAKPQILTPPLVTRFGVIPRV